MSASEILNRGAKELGIDLSDRQTEQFMLYLDRLKYWNRKINLTALTDDHDIVVKHFLDSLTPAEMIGKKAKLLDIGSGGGFPGVPLKIALPDLDVTLIESSGKKVSFLKDLIRKLKLRNIRAVPSRAEDAGNGLVRHSYDIVITRAVGSIERVLKLSLPYVKSEGRIILMRGALDEQQEDKYLEHAGVKLIYEKELTLPYGRDKRRLLIFKPGIG